jgi:hypothetical protein
MSNKETQFSIYKINLNLYEFELTMKLYSIFSSILCEIKGYCYECKR